MKRSDTGVVEMQTVVGVFPGYEEARRAVEALRDAGYRNDQIGVMGPEDREAAQRAKTGSSKDPSDTRWEEGAGIGAAAGGLAGLGLGAAVAAGLVSPIGPIVAGGTIVALLASTGAGAALGGVIGALVGLGVPEEEARAYVAELEGGRVLVTVRAANIELVQNILDQHGAINRQSGDNAIPGNALPATPY